jgi:3-phosphoshikimate 1-carboxyvinyltransferase
MKALAIRPLEQPPRTSIRVPGSKSLTNRALLAAALAEGVTHLENALFADDPGYFAAALQTLGFSIKLDEIHQQMTVHGLGGRIPARQASLFVGNAGTAARFLTAMLTLGQGEYLLDGEKRMRERPIGDLVRALNELGAQVSPFGIYSGPEVYPPLRIQANGLPGGTAHISGQTSSQYLSGLLLAAPYARQRVELQVTDELNSKPYVDMTLTVMADFGMQVERQGYEWFQVQPGQYTAQNSYTIESDASAAAYFFAVPAICGGNVQVENIWRRSRQGDIAFLGILERMGCRVKEGVSGTSVFAAERLQGIAVDMGDIPDTAQTLAVIAPFAETPTTIRGIASARLKESDRVAATCNELQRLGVSVEEHPDGMTIQPCKKWKPASIRTYNDHRMAMAFALVGLRVAGVSIEDPGCVSKTFPDFFQILQNLHPAGISGA